MIARQLKPDMSEKTMGWRLCVEYGDGPGTREATASPGSDCEDAVFARWADAAREAGGVVEALRQSDRKDWEETREDRIAQARQRVENCISDSWAADTAKRDLEDIEAEDPDALSVGELNREDGIASVIRNECGVVTWRVSIMAVSREELAEHIAKNGTVALPNGEVIKNGVGTDPMRRFVAARRDPALTAEPHLLQQAPRGGPHVQTDEDRMR